MTKPKENEKEVEADVHQAPVPVDPVPVVAPCGDCTKPCTPCVADEPEVSVEPEKKPLTPPPVIDDKPRVSFVNDEPTEDSKIQRDETPLPPPREESPKSSVSSVSSISSHSDKAPTPEPVEIEQQQEPVEEAPIEEEIIQEEMIAPIQRGMSTDSDKIGGMTLEDYEKSKKVAMDHFITEHVESKVEAAEEQRDNVQEIIEEDIIQPISRTFSQVSYSSMTIDRANSRTPPQTCPVRHWLTFRVRATINLTVLMTRSRPRWTSWNRHRSCWTRSMNRF